MADPSRIALCIMDPLTHALLGASVSYAAFGARVGPRAAAIGAVAALLPDADVLIRSSSDPLLAIEHHRGFTHSLLFAPLGGLIAAAPWIRGAIARGVPGATVGAAVLGYATHGPLDAATSYGTRLLWPFSDLRVGLDWISIIDPLFTVVLAVGLALALRRASARPAAAALALCAVYLALGSAQRARALETQARLADARGHDIVRAAVFPTFGNNLVWRSIYEAGDSLHLDRVRVGWRGGATSMRTDGVRVDPPGSPLGGRHRRDLGRFAWFSDGWIARDPADTTLVGDARYSMEMDRWEPVWGIRLHTDGRDPPTEWVDRSRDRRIDGRAVRAEVLGRHPAHRPVPERDPG
jgi:inner membrane protein